LLRDLEVLPFMLHSFGNSCYIHAGWFGALAAQHVFLLAGKRTYNSKECKQSGTIWKEFWYYKTLQQLAWCYGHTKCSTT
jgi:hypothetical protein